MKNTFCKLIFTFACVFGKLYGMSGFEVSPHMQGLQVEQIENQALVNYNYNLINLNHIGQPVQGNRTNFKLHLQNGIWADLMIEEIPENITLIQAIRVARTRVNLITVANDLLQAIDQMFNAVNGNQNRQIILQNALDTNLNEIQNFRQGIQGNFAEFVEIIRNVGMRLVNGGYGAYTSSVLYHVKFDNIADYFINMQEELLEHVRHVVFHIKLQRRCSKNNRELHLNSLNFNLEIDQEGLVFYESLKHKLNEIFVNCPSATVVSYTEHQEFVGQ